MERGTSRPVPASAVSLYLLRTARGRWSAAAYLVGACLLAVLLIQTGVPDVVRTALVVGYAVTGSMWLSRRAGRYWTAREPDAAADGS